MDKILWLYLVQQLRQLRTSFVALSSIIARHSVNFSKFTFSKDVLV